jgi:hypothetical protein
MIINGETYHILCDKLPIIFPFGSRGENPPIIASYNGVVCLIRDNDLHYGNERIVTLGWLKEDTIEASEKNWRNVEYKKAWVGFYTEIIKLMKSYQREVKIDDVLREEIDYNLWLC